MKPNKKYILKPGKHQFAPGSAAIHVNNNLSDEEAEWYIKRYPHIKTLFTINPKVGEAQSSAYQLTDEQPEASLISETQTPSLQPQLKPVKSK